MVVSAVVPLYHWYCRLPPVAATERLKGAPLATVVLGAGWVVMDGLVMAPPLLDEEDELDEEELLELLEELEWAPDDELLLELEEELEDELEELLEDELDEEELDELLELDELDVAATWTCTTALALATKPEELETITLYVPALKALALVAV